MASEVRVNQIQNRSGLGTITVADTGAVISGITTIDQGTTDGNLLDLKNEEVRLYTGVWGTGSTYPREVTLNGTRFDSGALPALRIAGQGGIKFAVDLNTVRMEIDSSGRVTKPYQPSFFVYGNTDVAISSADTFVKTTLWGGVSHNTGSHWSSNRFTAPVAGKYLFGVNLRLDNVNSGYSRVIIGKNGSTNLNVNGHSIARYEVYGAGYYTHNVTILFNMAVDDYVEVYAYASSDASFISQSESQWWGYLVG